MQIYANPIYELLDTKFGHFDEGTWSAYNTLVRIISRGCDTHLPAGSYSPGLAHCRKLSAGVS